MKNPNTFIVGAPKCGTTAMAEYLRQHPQVFFSKTKEPHHFLSDEMPGKSRFPTLSDYLSLFTTAGEVHKVVAEASVWYLYSQTALENIRAFAPDAKIIVMLRRPDEMVYAMHNQAVVTHNEDIKDFQIAWHLACSGKRTTFPEHCRDPSLLQYNEIALFGKQLQRALEFFPMNQIKIIFFDDFKANTPDVYRQTCEFLDLDSFDPEFNVINRNKQLRSATLGRLLKYPPASVFRFISKFKALIGLEHFRLRKTIQKLNSLEAERKPLPESLRREILDNYHDDIVLLETLVGRKLDSWFQ